MDRQHLTDREQLFQRLSLVGVCCLLMTSSLYGQLKVDDRVPADKKSVIAVNIDFEELFKNKLIRSLVLETPIDETGPFKHRNGTSKISAFVAAPKGLDFESLMSVNFYVYIGFDNARESSQLGKYFLANGGKEVNIDGKPYITPPNDIFLVQVNPMSIVIGSREYLTSPSNQFASKRLADIYSKLPESPVRIAVDMDGARGLLDPLKEMLDENANIFTKPYVSLIDEVASLSLTSDINKGSLLNLSLNGHDSDDGKKIKSKMDALLGLGKQFIDSAPDEVVGATFKAELEEIEAKQNGKAVSLAIDKPENFEKIVTNMVNRARKAANTAQELNQCRQVMIATINYHDVNQEFPFNKHVAGEDSGKGLSWAVHLLPYLENSALYDSFDMKGDYDSKQNAKLAKVVIPTYVFKSGQIKWVRPTKLANSYSSITDGSSNTVAFVLSKNIDMFPWTKATSITPKEVMEQFKALKEGEDIVFAMYDGSVRRITNETKASNVEAMLEPNDGKIPNGF